MRVTWQIAVCFNFYDACKCNDWGNHLVFSKPIECFRNCFNLLSRYVCVIQFKVLIAQNFFGSKGSEPFPNTVWMAHNFLDLICWRLDKDTDIISGKGNTYGLHNKQSPYFCELLEKVRFRPDKSPIDFFSIGINDPVCQVKIYRLYPIWNYRVKRNFYAHPKWQQSWWCW